MTWTRWIGAALMATLPAHAAARDTCADARIRSNSPELLQALTDGARRSPTLQTLVDRLDRSDTIVYLEFVASPIAGVAGRTMFLTAAGGCRYLCIRIDPRYRGCQLVSLLAHELRHALEIADEPSIVDRPSLVQFYRRMGFSRADGEGRLRLDSEAAIAAGRQVRDELTSH